MDIMFPSGMNGIECVKHLKDRMPEHDIDILMLSSYAEDELVFQSLKVGACGYLDKNTSLPRLIESIREVREGGAPMSSVIARMVVSSFKHDSSQEPELTRREKEVLEQLCKGKSYKMIADSIFVSEDTVRFHIKKIYKKLQVNSKSEAVIKALKNNLIG
jgi:DNA-binding NarL/FixJ family response regulator